ncbi:MAG: hypothetical protein ACYC2H_01310 [Thermoplasmatota archaeon]
MHYPAFIGGSHKLGNKFAANERTMNLYFEPVETEGGTNTGHLLPTPGVGIYSATAASNSSPGRALQLWNGRCFAVIGEEFIELLAGGARVVRGNVAADARPAAIVYNGSGGNQIAVSSGGGLYIYDMLTHAFAPVVTPSFAHSVVMIDGYFIVLDVTTSAIYQSNLLDGLTAWDGANTAKRIIAGDPWLQAHVHGKELWLLGELTSEVWYNAGTYPFAFAVHPSGSVNFGIAAPWSVVSVGDSLMWLARTKGGQGEVVLASGFQPRTVSDFAITNAIGQYSRIDDAIAWTYEEKGHHFYVINFPTGNATWSFDLSTGRWHERGTWLSEQRSFTQWRPMFHAVFEGRHLCTNIVGGEVLELLPDRGLDVDDRPIRRIRRAPYITNELRRIYFASFKLHLLTGRGATTGQGVEPLIELLVSDDGETWWSEGLESAGARGRYESFPEWTRLGSGENRIFEIQMSDPTPWAIVNAYIEAK